MPKATILIVEDEAIVAEDLSKKLGRLGYEVCGITAQGEEAVVLARDRRPDLVLMDIRLQGRMDGVEAAELIRREGDRPVIFLTAHSDRPTLQRAKLTEPFGYILKPFEELELETHIEMALYKHQTERKLRESEARLKVDLAALTRMHALSGRLLEARALQPLLQEIMDAAVVIMGAERGTLQLVEGDLLRIVAHHGHLQPFLEFFASAETRASVCGEAMKRAERVVVPDIETSPLFAGTPSLAVLREAGVRAVQSTPMVSRTGGLLGILTTQWGVPHSPDEHNLWRIDLLVRQAADQIEYTRAEQLRCESEERLRLAYQAARIGAFDWNLQTGVNVWTPELEAMYGLARGEFGKTQPAWEQLVHPEDRAAAVGLVNLTFSTGEPVQGEWRTIWRDGTVHWIAGRFQAFKDAAGKPMRLSGVNLDISRLKQAQAALEASNKELTHFNSLMVGRELRMIELKKEIDDLCVQFGQPPRYGYGRSEQKL